MKCVAFSLACVAVACGSSDDSTTRRGRQICARVAERLETRMRNHEADLPQLRAWAAAPDPSKVERHQDEPVLADFVATYRTARRLAPSCTTAAVVKECEVTPFVLDDLDGSIRAIRAVLRGMTGEGPCAPDRPQRSAFSCDILEMGPGGAEIFLDLVHEGWSRPRDMNGLATEHAGLAVSTMASWRAFVDYGVAIAPVCAPRVAASCEGLRENLASATPADLVARMRALYAAFHDGTACPAPGLLPGGAAVDAGPTE